MRYLAVIIAVFLSISSSATNYIYRFDAGSNSNDDYFELLMDFDGVPNSTVDGAVNVTNYDDFVRATIEWSQGQAEIPFWNFNVSLRNTNIESDFQGSNTGRIALVANENPVQTQMSVSGLGFLEAGPDPFAFIYMAPGWELGTIIFRNNNTDYVLTSKTAVPIPAAVWLLLSGVGFLAINKRR